MRDLETFKSAALAAGVAPDKLDRLDVAQTKAAGITAALATYYETPSPLAEYLASPSPPKSPGDLAEVARAEALHVADRQALESAELAAADTADAAFAALLDDVEWLDSLMADVSATYATARAALDKIGARWGTDNPDAANVVAVATAAELKEYRGRAGHVTALANVRRFIELLTGLIPMHGRAVAPVNLAGAHLLRDYRNYTQALALFTADDGTLGTIGHARAELNRLNARAEQRDHAETCAYTFPKPEFHARYTLGPGRESAELDRDGRPLDAAALITADEYVDQKR